MKFQPSWQGSDLLLNVHVQPRAAKDEIVGCHGERLKIRISAPPVDGKANKHLVGFLAETFQVAKRDIILIAGESGRDKCFKIISPKHVPESIAKSQCVD